MARKKIIRFQLEDAFPTKEGAKASASGLRTLGDLVRVRAIKPQGGSGGRLKFGVFVGFKNGTRAKRRK